MLLVRVWGNSYLMAKEMEQRMIILQAHFDGTNIVLDEPAELKPNMKLKVLIEKKNDESSRKVEKNSSTFRSFPKPIKTGIPDFAEQHDHYLYGTEKRAE